MRHLVACDGAQARTMERRKFVIGMGSLAAGGAAALGTGAFGSADAERNARVQVVGDSSAYLQMTEGPHTTDVVRQVSDDELSFDLGADSGHGGSGMNQNGGIEWTDVVTVKNAGAQTVWFGVDLEEVKNLTGIEDANMYAHHDPGSPEYDGQFFDPNGDYPASVSTPAGNQNTLIDIAPGNEVRLSLHIETNDNVNSGSEAPIYFMAIEKGGQYDNTQGDNDGD